MYAKENQLPQTLSQFKLIMISYIKQKNKLQKNQNLNDSSSNTQEMIGMQIFKKRFHIVSMIC